MNLRDKIRGSFWRLDDLLIARSILTGSLAAGAVLLKTSTAPAEESIGWWIPAVIILVALTNIPFFVLAHRGRQRSVSWAMIFVDIIFVTFLVSITSGAQSSVAVFYFWPIIASSLLLGARATYLVSGLGAALYLGLAVAESGGWEPRNLLASQGISAVEGLDAILVRVSAFLLIALLSGMLSNALLQSNAQLLEAKSSLEKELGRLQSANQRLAALDEMSRALGRIQSLDNLLPRAQVRLTSFMGVDSGFVTLLDRSTGEARVVSRQNVDEETCRSFFSSGLPPKVDAMTEYVVDQDDREDQNRHLLREVSKAGFHACLAAPLRVGEEYLGTLYLLTQPPHRFKRSDAALLASLTAQLSIAIKNVLFTEELKAANEELLHLDQLKSDFLATMSHELRTPLTSIIGYSDMVLSGMTGEVNEKQKGFLRSILNNGENLLNLINDILDLTKIEAGRLELALEPVELRSVLTSVLTVVKPRAQEKQIQVSTFLPTDLPPLLADSSKLQQILLNLMTNAIKYTYEHGSVSIEARTGDGSVEIRVIDTGVGIREEDAERIFERFTQVDGSSTRSQRGTGLGLAITKDLIELHGGKITLQSQPGRGSTFIFTVPQAVQQPDHMAAGTLS